MAFNTSLAPSKLVDARIQKVGAGVGVSFLFDINHFLSLRVVVEWTPPAFNPPI